MLRTTKINQAVSELRSGRVVAYPTESFFALGADATNARAIRRVFSLKKRKHKPIALIAGSVAQVEKFFHVNAVERRLMRKYWPGALTILLVPKKKIAADALWGTTPSRSFDRATPPPRVRGDARRGRVGIGVRVPKHALARTLALLAGAPITATSANPSGGRYTKSALRVAGMFPRIPLLHGRCGSQRSTSTIVELRNHRMVTIREGSVKV